MPRTITVIAVHGAGDPFGEDKDWGPLIPYDFEAEGVEGRITWNRKPGSPGPKVGDTLTGDITENEYGKKFKLARQGGGGFGGGGRSPQENRKIVRQHSQHTAVALLTLAAQLKKTPQETWELVSQVASWLDGDVEKAGV